MKGEDFESELLTGQDNNFESELLTDQDNDIVEKLMQAWPEWKDEENLDIGELMRRLKEFGVDRAQDSAQCARIIRFFKDEFAYHQVREERVSTVDPAFKQYLKDLMDLNPPLLSKEESRYYSRIFRAGKDAKAQLEHDQGTLTEVEQKDLEAQMRKGKQAFGQLIEGNLRWVLFWVKEYMNLGVSPEDLLGEGNLGLLKAAQRYDPDRAAFTTYSSYWIRNYLRKAISSQGSFLPVSKRIQEDDRKIAKVIDRYQMECGRSPSIEELVEETHLTSSRISTVRREIHNRVLVSDSAPVKHGNCDRADKGLTVAETIEDMVAKKDLEDVLAESVRLDVRGLMGQYLPRLEEFVLHCHYGMESGISLTHESIGHILGYTKQRIQQIDKNAVEKLRNTGSVQKYKENQLLAL